MYDLLYAPSPTDEEYLENLSEYLVENDWVNEEYEKLSLKHLHLIETLHSPGFKRKNLQHFAETFSYEKQPLLIKFSNPEKMYTIQQPSAYDIGSFWNFVVNTNVYTIISLNSLPTRLREKFWPDERTVCIKPMEHIIVTYTNLKQKESYDQIGVTLTVLLGTKPISRYLTLYQLKNWCGSSGVPDNLDVFIEFQEIVNSSTDKVLVACS